MFGSNPLPRISGLLVALMMATLTGAWTANAYGPGGQTAPPENAPPSYGPPPSYAPPDSYRPRFGHGPGTSYGPPADYVPPSSYGLPFGHGPGAGHGSPFGSGPPTGYGPPFGHGPSFGQAPPFGPRLRGGPADLDPTWPSGYGPEPDQELDQSFGSESVPGGYPAMEPGRFGPPAPTQTRVRTGELSFNQLVTGDAYILEIQLDGQWPEAIQIEPRGQGILIRRASSTRTSDQRGFDDGRGYAHRYSYASGTMTRRLPVPPDGDLAALTREDGPYLIRVSIPRRSR